MKSPGLPVRSLPFSFGAIHGLVDFISALVVYRILAAHNLDIAYTFNLILGYDLLAFGGQVFIGIITDRIGSAKPALFSSFILLGASVFLCGHFTAGAVVAVGLGNALFHVAAGALSLRVRPGKALFPGVFVAPGAIGLAYGIKLGKAGVFPEILLPVLLGAALLVTLRTAFPQMPYRSPVMFKPVRWGALIVILLLVTVWVRSVGGLVGGGYCVRTPYTALAIAFAAFLGKGLGGWIADRFGWLKVSLIMLIVSAPLIAYGYTWLPVVIAGMFLFQMTMPVTLTAVAQVMPRRPATAFGLTCLALIAGALPMFNDIITPYKSHNLVFVLVMVSALTTWIALVLLRKSVPSEQSKI